MADAVVLEWKRRDPLLSDFDGFLRDFNKMHRKMERQTKEQISKLVKVFAAPIIVAPSGWHDTIPKWMKSEVTLQRLVQIMKGEEGVATDIEALVYLYTATFMAPFNESWTNVYVYLTKKCMEGRRKTWPKELGNPTLTDYQRGLLDDLKRWIWKQTEKAFARVK